jgi:RimJ/RimL family protein N-acetyltransferase
LSSALPERPAGPLSDGVVTLREWREADVPAIVAMCDDPEVARFTRVPSPYTEDDARDFLAGKVMDEMAFAIVSARDDDDVLGSIGLRDDGEGRGQVGYLVAAHVRRQRVATRALRLLAEWALNEGGLARVQLYTRVDNPASSAQRSARASGARA